MTKNNDYSAWEHQDLIQRVHELEQKLHQQTQAAVPLINGNGKKTQEKKPAKPFDPSRYSTRKIALKFAYLGAAYNGLEHHTNNITPLPAVEEIVWRALVKTKLIFPQHKPGQSQDEVCWDGCEYSKCGRTDKGVSAFGQVIGVRVRSARPLLERKEIHDVSDGETASYSPPRHEKDSLESVFDPIADELPYVALLNKVLPNDVRVLAWCSDLPDAFDARFSCRERRYRYFFTNPAYLPMPDSSAQSEGWLDIEAMQTAAKKYEGLHDFRNLCKIDPSKQITNFERRIFHAGIHAVNSKEIADRRSPKLYYFEVRGSAFLWHQVRHLVAVLFLIGQRLEDVTLVDELLDVTKTPGRPLYEMADDTPLVLWDCIFPAAGSTSDHSYNAQAHSYDDALPWIYAGDTPGGPSKHSARGIMNGLWSFWRQRKMDEILANQLMRVVDQQGRSQPIEALPTSQSQRVFEGGHAPRSVGPYTLVLKRPRMDTAEVQNARFVARKSSS